MPLPNGKIRFAALYGAGAVMGFTPQETDRMSLWQWLATVNGYIEAHQPKGGNTLSEAEKDSLWDFVGGRSAGPRLLTTVTYAWDGGTPVPRETVTFTA